MTSAGRIGFLVLLLGVATAAAQEPLETRGAWRVVPDGEDFALRAPANSAADTAFSLRCHRVQRIFAFEIRSAALAAMPRGEDIRLGFKVDDGEQVWLSLSTGADGTIPLTHQTAFWIVHAAIGRSGAKEIALTAGDHAWTFALDGFADLIESLSKRCGFEVARSLPSPRQ